MKNTFGISVALTLFGESHGKAVGAVIDGLAPGVIVSEEKIAAALAGRAPQENFETSRRERDEFEIISGIFNGRTTGTPLTIIIPNTAQRSSDYSYGLARPSHADYSAYCKYHGFEDYRGGGHFSGRVTAALVAAGTIFETALENLGVTLGTHILRCGNAADRDFRDVSSDINDLKIASFPVLNRESREKICAEINESAKIGDSIGGIVQTGVCGLPAGLGEPWFDSVEGVLSHALFSIGGIKGVDFGSGFDGCMYSGSQFNDVFMMENGKVVTKTNHNGGINGGITNGMPIVFRCAVKPTPSIAVKQETVNFLDNSDAEINICGRYDPAIIRRICPVIDAVTALVLCDLLAQRLGTDVFIKRSGKCFTD